MTPSPMARPLQVTDLRTWGTRRTQVERDTHRATVRAHAMRAGHPSVAPYDHEAEPRLEVTVLLALSLGEAARVRTMCEQSPHVDDHAIGAAIRRQMTDRTVVESDPCPPGGYPRPGGVA